MPNSNEKKSDVGENDVRRVNLEHNFEIDSDITESNVLHDKNLSFKTTDESLKQHLTELVKQGKILSVKVLEWAKDDDSMEANRARSAAKYMTQGNNNSDKRKSSTVDERRIKFERNS